MKNNKWVITGIVMLILFCWTFTAVYATEVEFTIYFEDEDGNTILDPEQRTIFTEFEDILYLYPRSIEGYVPMGKELTLTAEEILANPTHTFIYRDLSKHSGTGRVTFHYWELVDYEETGEKVFPSETIDLELGTWNLRQYLKDFRGYQRVTVSVPSINIYEDEQEFEVDLRYNKQPHNYNIIINHLLNDYMTAVVPSENLEIGVGEEYIITPLPTLSNYLVDIEDLEPVTIKIANDYEIYKKDYVYDFYTNYSNITVKFLDLENREVAPSEYGVVTYGESEIYLPKEVEGYELVHDTEQITLSPTLPGEELEHVFYYDRIPKWEYSIIQCISQDDKGNPLGYMEIKKPIGTHTIAKPLLTGYIITGEESAEIEVTKLGDIYTLYFEYSKDSSPPPSEKGTVIVKSVTASDTIETITLTKEFGVHEIEAIDYSSYILKGEGVKKVTLTSSAPLATVEFYYIKQESSGGWGNIGGPPPKKPKDDEDGDYNYSDNLNSNTITVGGLNSNTTTGKVSQPPEGTSQTFKEDFHSTTKAPKATLPFQDVRRVGAEGRQFTWYAWDSSRSLWRPLPTVVSGNTVTSSIKVQGTVLLTSTPKHNLPLYTLTPKQKEVVNKSILYGILSEDSLRLGDNLKVSEAYAIVCRAFGTVDQGKFSLYSNLHKDIGYVGSEWYDKYSRALLQGKVINSIPNKTRMGEDISGEGFAKIVLTLTNEVEPNYLKTLGVKTVGDAYCKRFTKYKGSTLTRLQAVSLLFEILEANGW